MRVSLRSIIPMFVDADRAGSFLRDFEVSFTLCKPCYIYARDELLSQLQLLELDMVAIAISCLIARLVN